MRFFGLLLFMLFSQSSFSSYDVPLEEEKSLFLAAKKGHVMIVQGLLNEGVDIDTGLLKNSPLIEAVKAGNFDVLEFLVNKGANVNRELNVEAINKNLNQADLDHPAVAKEVRAELGKTSLHLAAESGNAKIIQFLLKHKATLEKKTALGWTALHFAVRNGDEESVKTLLSAEADVNSPNLNGVTPLVIALLKKNLKLAEELVKHGAYVNFQRQKDGVGIIHFIASVDREGMDDVLEFLINHKVNVNLKTSNGLSALHLASEKGYHKRVKILLNNSAEVDCKSNDGATPLHCAIEGGSTLCAKELLEFGADTTKKLKGQNAWAMARKNKTILAILAGHPKSKLEKMINGLGSKEKKEKR